MDAETMKEKIQQLLWGDRGLEAEQLARESGDSSLVEMCESWLGHTKSKEAYAAFYAEHRGLYILPEAIPGRHESIPRLGQIRRWMLERRPSTILDLGCFDGFALLNLCHGLGAHGVGVDLDRRALAYAADCATKLGLSCAFAEGFAESVELPNKYDAILVMELLEHVIDPKAVLQNAERHLAPGGRIYITTPATPVPHNGNEKEAREHLRCLSEEELYLLIGDRVIEQAIAIEVPGHVDRALYYRKPKTVFVVNPVAGGWDARNSRSYGGSEEAAVGLAEELAQQGHEVEVYHNRVGTSADYELNGVRYPGRLSEVEADICVVIKWPEFLDSDIKAKKIFFWTTDPNTPDHFKPSRMRKVDKVVPLTPWHYEELMRLNPDLEPAKVQAIPYGIQDDLLHCKPPLERNPHTMVYASSYDRGLEILLDNWFTIKDRVPDAELHVWYGWDLFDRVTGAAAGFGAARQWKDQMIQKLKQPGIIEHPRTTPDDPAPFMNVAIWAYPCIGGERFCLVASKAQKLGAVPVYFPTMALRDTVRYGFKPVLHIPEHPQQSAQQFPVNEYIKCLVETLQSEEWQIAERQKMIADPDVALSWERVYREHWYPLWAESFRPGKNGKAPAQIVGRQSLSVCMITRNAEELILRTLKSVKGLAQEIIVADQSSTDRTVEFVREFGARVIEHTHNPFYCLTCNSQEEGQHFLDYDHEPYGFEGPRNDSIREAEGDFILWIDSDEELLRPHNLEKYLRRNCFKGYAIRQHHFSAVPPNAFKVDLPVRVFRNRIGATFVGKVHEHPETKMNESIMPCIVLSDVDIAHDGYFVEEGRRKKFQRNIGLMKADRRCYPERLLGKFLWLRDLIHLTRYELESTGGRLTPNSVSWLEEAVVLYEKEFLGGEGLYAQDGMDYYSEALRILNRGFEAVWAMGASPQGANPPEPSRCRFSSVEAWLKALEGHARARVAPFTGKYV